MARRTTTSIPVNVVSTPKPSAPISPLPPQPSPRPPASEEHKRRMMWWIVGFGTLGAIAIWIWLWPMQMGRTARDTTFDRIVNLFHSTTKQETKGEKEIRALDKEVFPQFQ